MLVFASFIASVSGIFIAFVSGWMAVEFYWPIFSALASGRFCFSMSCLLLSRTGASTCTFCVWQHQVSVLAKNLMVVGAAFDSGWVNGNMWVYPSGLILVVSDQCLLGSGDFESGGGEWILWFSGWLDVRAIFPVIFCFLSLCVGLFRFCWLEVHLWFFGSRFLGWHFWKCSSHGSFCLVFVFVCSFVW